MRLTHIGRWLTDPEGRVVLLHGGNVIELADDARRAGADAPKSAHWDSATPRLMAEAGFNAVRLAIFMDRVEPQEGRVDPRYLKAVATTVADYAAYGIWTLIDFHQDEFGPEVGIRGMPAWMTLTGGLKRIPHLPFPNGYFRDPAVKSAFDHFWANAPVASGEPVQSAYLAAASRVARRFAADPAVFGIDLMNEPDPGTPCSTPDPRAWRQAHCGRLEAGLLSPFYTDAGRAISAVAPETLLFVEPFMLQGALGVPIHTPMPGIAEQGLSFHNYGSFPSWRDHINGSALADAIARDAAIINTEWGNTNDAGVIASRAQAFDRRLIPWLAWAAGPLEAMVNPAAGSEPANRPEVLRAYARPYPTATAGTPLSLSFDADSGELVYRWATRGPDGVDRERLATEIAMPYPSYPHGYHAQVTGGRIISEPNAPMLEIRATHGATEVTVRAARIGALPPLATASAIHTPGSRLSLDSPLAALLREPRSRAILKQYLPSLFSGRALALAPQISLRAMQPYDPQMTQQVMKRVAAALAALPAR